MVLRVWLFVTCLGGMDLRVACLDPASLLPTGVDARWVVAAPVVAAGFASGVARVALSALDEDSLASEWDRSDPGRWTRAFDEWGVGEMEDVGGVGDTI